MSTNTGKFRSAQAVREILQSNDYVRTLVEDKVFPIVANEGTIGDYILVRRIGYDRDRSKIGVSNNECIVVILAVSNNYDRSVDIIEACDKALEGKFDSSVFGGDFTGGVTASEEDYMDGKFIQVLEIIFK